MVEFVVDVGFYGVDGFVVGMFGGYVEVFLDGW